MESLCGGLLRVTTPVRFFGAVDRKQFLKCLCCRFGSAAGDHKNPQKKGELMGSGGVGWLWSTGVGYAQKGTGGLFLELGEHSSYFSRDKLLLLAGANLSRDCVRGS